MARVYDIAVAALALGVDRKWLDNLVAQHTMPGAEHFARGVARRLSMRTLVTAALVRDLNRELGVPVARGVGVAIGMLQAPAGAAPPVDDGAESVPAASTDSASPAVRRVASGIALSVDIAALEREIETRLLAAMETAVPRRRGRPPLKRRRGTR